MLASLPFVGSPRALPTPTCSTSSWTPSQPPPALSSRRTWSRAGCRPAAARDAPRACTVYLEIWAGSAAALRPGVRRGGARGLPASHDLRSIAGGCTSRAARGSIPSTRPTCAQTDLPDDDRFHLYLSGPAAAEELLPARRLRAPAPPAGHRRRLVPGPFAQLPVKNVTQRVREETLTAVHETFGPATHAEVARSRVNSARSSARPSSCSCAGTRTSPRSSSSSTSWSARSSPVRDPVAGAARPDLLQPRGGARRGTPAAGAVLHRLAQAVPARLPALVPLPPPRCAWSSTCCRPSRRTRSSSAFVDSACASCVRTTSSCRLDLVIHQRCRPQAGRRTSAGAAQHDVGADRAAVRASATGHHGGGR